MANARTPKRYDTDAVEVCRILSGKAPVDVPIKLESYSKDAFCWFNVWEKVRIDGGEVVYGWMIAFYKGIQVMAYPHAVWKSPDGGLVDITAPQHPTLDQQRTLFVEDTELAGLLANAQPKTPRPTYRLFPLKLRRMWPLVSARCREHDVLRLAGKDDEAKALIKDLENTLNAGLQGSLT
jgi:hypothetical protein